MIQILIITLCIMGQRLINHLPSFSQRYLAYINEKKWKIGFITFLVGNQISSIISSTGAFEIYCNNTEIFSKLKSNSMPSIDLIIESIKQLGLTLRN